MDELHGAQRHRLGWSEADVEREMPLLLAEVGCALLASVEMMTTAGAHEAEAGSDATFSPPAIRAATRYAADVVRHITDRSTRTALRGFHFAKATEAR